MSRKSFQVSHTAPKVDTLYQSQLVRMFVNQIIKNGKSRLAHTILYTAIENIGETAGQDGLDVLRKSVVNVTPLVEVRPRRIGGSVYQVPMEVTSERGTALAIRWIVQSARKRPGRGMTAKLAAELLDASKQTGNAVRKREDMHRMAEANKAFAHLR